MHKIPCARQSNLCVYELTTGIEFKMFRRLAEISQLRSDAAGSWLQDVLMVLCLLVKINHTCTLTNWIYWHCQTLNFCKAHTAYNHSLQKQTPLSDKLISFLCRGVTPENQSCESNVFMVFWGRGVMLWWAEEAETGTTKINYKNTCNTKKRVSRNKEKLLCYHTRVRRNECYLE